MEPKPQILVLGGTGDQGGSVVRHLLEDGTFKLRVLTRNQDSEKAKALADQGVQIFGGSYTDEAALSSAMQGAYGVFAMTNFWDPGSFGQETEQGTEIVRIAKEAGVQHFQWSTLPNVEEQSGGKLAVPHFTGKAKVDAVVKAAGFKYHTFIVPGFYYQNFIKIPWLGKRDESGEVVFKFDMDPSNVLQMYDVEDTGLAAVVAFKEPEKFHDQYLSFCGMNSSLKDMAAEFEKVTGVKARFGKVAEEDLAGYPPGVSDDLKNMFEWFKEYGYYGNYDFGSCERAVGRKLTSWEEWLNKTGFKG